jgi:hypothetical protein
MDETERSDETSSDFVKGELSNVGVEQFTSRRNRAIASAGYNYISKVNYLLINPQLGLRFGDLSLGVGAPLNLEMLSFAYPKDPAPNENHIVGFNNLGKVRREDWDEPSEYARVLTYLTYGHKEDRLYIDIGQQHTSTLGHGAIMRRYTPNIDINAGRVGAQLDTYNEYAGFELMTNDVVLWNIMGLLGFVKPLSILGADSMLAKSVSLGATFAIDREAPRALQFREQPNCPVSGQCPHIYVSDVDDKNRLMAQRGPVSLGGVDLELKVVKTDSVDIKPYIDYSKMLTSAEDGRAGGGLTLGVLGRFNAGLAVKHAFRLIAEVRFLEDGYRPGYFDSFYEIDKFLMGGTGGVKPGSTEEPLTKFQSTVGPNRVPGGTGYYLEVSYGVREVIGLTLALEGQPSGGTKNFVAHLELPECSIVQLFATLYKRDLTDLSSVFSIDSHAIGFAGARVKILPILFLSARAYKMFELDAFKGADGPLGTGQFKNSVGYSGDLQLGWEF